MLTRAIIYCGAILSLPLSARTAHAHGGPLVVMYIILFQYIIVFAVQLVIFVFMAYGIVGKNRDSDHLKEL